MPQARPDNLRAQMGALNAVHAAPEAFANAAPNSRVGMIAAYAEAANTATAAQAELEAAESRIGEISDELTELQASLEDPDLTEEEQEAIEDQIAALEDEQAELVSALEGLEEAVTESELNAQLALEEAANKEVTPEVQEEVDRVLAEKGLLDGGESEGEGEGS